MAVIRSAIPSVYSAVLALLTANMLRQAAGGGNVAVFDGELTTYTPDEFVVLNGISNGRQSWGSIGTQRRNETFDINGMARAWTGGDNQAALRQRVFDLLALIESALDNDPFVSNAVNGTVQISVGNVRFGVQDDGRFCEADFYLSVVTQLIAV